MRLAQFRANIFPDGVSVDEYHVRVTSIDCRQSVLPCSKRTHFFFFKTVHSCIQLWSINDSFFPYLVRQFVGLGKEDRCVHSRDIEVNVTLLCSQSSSSPARKKSLIGPQFHIVQT